VARNSISLSYVTKILASLARSGVSLEELFQDAGLDLTLLAVPEARLDTTEFTRLLQIVMRRTEDEFIGLWRGAKSKPGTFSMMAHAVINCRNLEKAIQRSNDFYRLLDLPVSLQLDREGENAAFTLTVGEGEARDIILESMVFISVRFWSWLTGQNIRPVRIELDFPEPAEAREYRYAFACPVEFGGGANRIILRQAQLELPLVQNPLSLSRFLKDSLALIIVGNMQPIGLAEQIRAIISKEYGNNFPDFSLVCEKLNMTPQTLRRRLKEGNTSYQEIKDSIRHDAAVYYLGKAELSIDEIALMMGFSEASSFHRAFKKWTGKTPAGYRRDLLGLDVDTDELTEDLTEED
jgi:AraC-like DNA-binding protein